MVEKTKKTQKKDFFTSVDKKLNIFSAKCKIVKFIDNSKFVKDIVSSNFMNIIDKKLHLSFDTIMKVFGVLGIISGIFGIFAFLAIVFSSYFFGPYFFRLLIISIIMLFVSVLSLVSGYGLLNLKKWAPAIIILNFVLGLFVTIIFSFVSLSYISGDFSNIISFVISGFLMLLILKNKDKFNN